MATIFEQYLQPVRSIQDRMADLDAQDYRREQLAGAKQQNQLQALAMQRDAQTRAEAEQDKSLLQQYAGRAGGDQNAFIKMLRGSGRMGLMTQGDAIEKALLERQKSEAEVKDKEASTLKSHFTALKTLAGGVLANPTPEAPLFAIDAFERMTGRKMPEERARIAQLKTPEDIKRWAASHALEADKLLPQIQNRDTGGAVQTLAVDLLTGLPTITGSVAKTATPGDLLTDRRTREEGVANRGVQWARIAEDKRQFGIKEARESSASAEGTSPTPLMGLPKPTVLPWANQTNPRDANKVKAGEIQRGSKEVEKDAEAATQARQIAADAQRFLELNAKVGTGGITDKVGIGRAVQGLGSDYAEMESITARLAPAMRQPGAGATSDYDAKQFERATVGVDKPQATNKNIAAAIVARAKTSEDYALFRQSYLEQNGTLQGADRYWKQYSNENPIFDPSKPGAFQLNESRQDWKGYFAGEKPKPAPKPPAPSPAPKPAAGKPSVSNW